MRPLGLAALVATGLLLTGCVQEGSSVDVDIVDTSPGPTPTDLAPSTSSP